MKLVDNWTQSWKWVSQQCFAAISTISIVWATVVPADMKPGGWGHCYTASMIVLSLLGIFGRTIQQPSMTPMTPADIAQKTEPKP